MTIQQLHYFLTLCQELNYSHAAARLYLSRQALRQSIQALEQELCSPLFANDHNHLSLTQKGQQLRDLAAPVVEQFDQMCQKARRHLVTHPVIRLGISQALVPDYLPSLGITWTSSGKPTLASPWKPSSNPTTRPSISCWPASGMPS